MSAGTGRSHAELVHEAQQRRVLIAFRASIVMAELAYEAQPRRAIRARAMVSYPASAVVAGGMHPRGALGTARQTPGRVHLRPENHLHIW